MPICPRDVLVPLAVVKDRASHDVCVCNVGTHFNGLIQVAQTFIQLHHG